MSESNIQKEIMLAASKANTTLWRNNTAQAWVGDATKIVSPRTVNLYPGDVVIRNARPLHAGLCVGSSDLIGVTPVEVRAEHVGRTFGVFTALEVKAPKGRPTTQQLNFIDHIVSCGGLAGIARSADDALSILQQHDNSP